MPEHLTHCAVGLLPCTSAASTGTPTPKAHDSWHESARTPHPHGTPAHLLRRGPPLVHPQIPNKYQPRQGHAAPESALTCCAAGPPSCTSTASSLMRSFSSSVRGERSSFQSLRMPRIRFLQRPCRYQQHVSTAHMAGGHVSGGWGRGMCLSFQSWRMLQMRGSCAWFEVHKLQLVLCMLCRGCLRRSCNSMDGSERNKPHGLCAGPHSSKRIRKRSEARRATHLHLSFKLIWVRLSSTCG